MAKAELIRCDFEFFEFVRHQVTFDRQKFRRWLEVLSESDDVDVVFAEILLRRQNLCFGLADAKHHAGLGEHVRLQLFRDP